MVVDEIKGCLDSGICEKLDIVGGVCDKLDFKTSSAGNLNGRKRVIEEIEDEVDQIVEGSMDDGSGIHWSG